MHDFDAGAFAAGDLDATAADMSARWEHRWPDAEPSGPSLRAAFPDRWVRLYTLPEGRRPARTADDRAEVRRRVDAVRAALAGAGTSLVVGEDWGAGDGAGGWTRDLLPGARPWRIAHGDDAPSYFWVASPDETAALIDAVGDDRAALLFTDTGLRWALSPYDGGMDVFLSDAATRDEIARRFADWASPRPDGL